MGAECAMAAKEKEVPQSSWKSGKDPQQVMNKLKLNTEFAYGVTYQNGLSSCFLKYSPALPSLV